MPTGGLSRELISDDKRDCTRIDELRQNTMRIKIIGQHHKYKVGEIVEVSRNEAFGLLDSGVGVQTKELEKSDYKGKRRIK